MVLCVPAISTPAELAFSAAGLIVNNQRASLLPANVDAQVFLNKNMSTLSSTSGKKVPVAVQERLEEELVSLERWITLQKLDKPTE